MINFKTYKTRSLYSWCDSKILAQIRISIDINVLTKFCLTENVSVIFF